MRKHCQIGVENSRSKFGLHFSSTSSDHSIRRWSKNAKISTRKAEIKPDARLTVEFSSRRAIVQVIMWATILIYAAILCRMISYDATEIEIDPEEKKTKVTLLAGYK